MLFLDERKLEEAIVIHEACYDLLGWLSSAIDRGIVRSARAHEYLSEADAAGVWIAEHFANIPPSCRPASRSGEGFDRFARYFASYLRTSFNSPEASHARLMSSCGCWCGFCSYIGVVSRLQPKGLGPVDKRRAEKRKRVCVEELACRGGVRLPDAEIARLAADATLSIDVALVAYAADLLRRCDGSGAGPAALALWRQIAWRSGRPDRGFKLTVRGVGEAEARVIVRIRAAEKGEGQC